MDALIFLVPVALGLGLLGLAGFLWSMKTGQYEDLDGAAWRAIMDDDEGAASPHRVGKPILLGGCTQRRSGGEGDAQ
ncbi:cbb3-type cytochrome oxidase maturation protein [Tepidamorphus gemmatus]|uniref:Cbb3-type cytochrome oxidase maturation protein n=1 Tax=Tepidamorphus gemmatus TaxID=747076 RepID=A0A4R3MBQ8_9HYPH|nr:cbb3-type cytochrome oxidase assembly protein CcoS [Tepidamorphus gemmatus]TCT09377.1 cbb3-type cytochrome oxidase maturation protein [Tepidamorphus gemmatus]